MYVFVETIELITLVEVFLDQHSLLAAAGVDPGTGMEGFFGSGVAQHYGTSRYFCNEVKALLAAHRALDERKRELDARQRELDARLGPRRAAPGPQLQAQASRDRANRGESSSQGDDGGKGSSEAAGEKEADIRPGPRTARRSRPSLPRVGRDRSRSPLPPPRQAPPSSGKAPPQQKPAPSRKAPLPLTREDPPPPPSAAASSDPGSSSGPRASSATELWVSGVPWPGRKYSATLNVPPKSARGSAPVFEVSLSFDLLGIEQKLNKLG